MIYKRLSVSILANLVFFNLVFAQSNITIKNDFYRIQNIEFNQNPNIILDTSKTSSIRFQSYDMVENDAYILVERNKNYYKSHKILFSKSEQDTQLQYWSNLIILKFHNSKLELFKLTNKLHKLNAHYMYAPFIKFNNFNKLYKRQNPCDKPSMISYTIWRQGLPLPKPGRIKTDVKHLVIHHSAANNDDTNYINIVRNYYLLHTQTNGWDDIGYNYLIASNGLIFIGRDPQGVCNDDEVQGAHFCAKNGNTLGICMIGNFMLKKPNNPQIESLKYLLAWKTRISNINPFGFEIHPPDNGTNLNSICGHKDGCNTQCPGDSLYKLIPNIINDVNRIKDSCTIVTSIYYTYRDLKIFPNPNNGYFYVTASEQLYDINLKIYDMIGNEVFSSNYKLGDRIVFDKKGVFNIEIYKNDNLIRRSKLIIK